MNSPVSGHLRDEYLAQFIQQVQRLEPDYTPPTVSESEEYSDSYALACIVYELFTRQPLRTLYDERSDVRVSSLPTLPPAVRSLIEALLSLDCKRTDLSSLLHHVAFPRYFSSLYFFLLRFNALETSLMRVHLTRRCLPQLLALPDEGFHLLLPFLLTFYSSPPSDTTTTLHALKFLDRLIFKLGRTQAHKHLLPVITSLLERQNSPILYGELVSSNMLNVYTQTLGLVSLVQHILPHIRTGLVSSLSEIAQLASRALVDLM